MRLRLPTERDVEALAGLAVHVAVGGANVRVWAVNAVGVWR
jgi:hypothetical protein